MSSMQPMGYIVRLSSYTEAEAVALTPLEESLQRGQLVEVVDHSQGGVRYLAVITDVSETEPQPLIDPEAFQELLREARAERIDAAELLRVMLDPTSPFRFTTTVRLGLRILGRLYLANNRVTLSDIGRPPRPRSTIHLPETSLLEQLLCPNRPGIAPIGRLSLRSDVRVCIDLEKLNTHMAVLGQTGSGKTETVKRLVYETIRSWLAGGQPRRGVIVMDVAGEYTGYPYHPSGATPLLEALAHSNVRTRITIIVPFDPLYTHPGLVESGVAELAENLSRLYGGARVAGIVLHARSSTAIMVYPRPRTELTPAELQTLLVAAEMLVVAAPLPDTMPLGLLLELGAFNEDAEYTAALHEALEELEEYNVVSSVTLLADIARMAVDARPQGRDFSYPTSIDILPVCRARDEDQLLDAVKSQLSTAIGALHQALTGVRLREPSVWVSKLTGNYLNPSLGVLRSECSTSPDRVRERLLGIARAVYRMARSDVRSRKALYRRLSRVARVASPALNPLTARLLAWRVFNGLTILHLAPPSVGGVNHPLVTWLLNEVFEEAVRRYTLDQRMLIVVEEAHNLAPSREDTFSKRMLVRYAREGRKWGLGLVIVTQRPVGVDPTILSQAATLVALRMTNPEDIQAVKSSVESATAELVERLPDLDRGEALASGNALPERRIPLLARIDMIGR